MKIVRILFFTLLVAAFASVAMAASITIYKNGSVEGTYTFGSQTIDSNGNSTLYVTGSTPPPSGLALALNPTSLPSGTEGSSYGQSVAMSASGGSSPYSYACSGSGVAGITASNSGSSSCLISGTPTGTGIYTATFTTTDNASASTQSTISFTVNPSGGGGGDPSGTVTLPYNKLNDSYIIGANSVRYFKAVLPSTCNTTNRQLKFSINLQESSPNVDLLVKKSQGLTLPWPTVADYNKFLSLIGYNLGQYTSNYNFMNFSTYSGGETVVVNSSYSAYPNFNQADTYYILVDNPSSTSTSMYVRFWCY